MTPLDAAAEALGLESLEVVATLGGSSRSEVWRAATPRGTVVVKHHLQPEYRSWVREAAGLRAADGVIAPRLLAVREDPAVVVMSDLGQAPSLADLLLGTDPAAADDGVSAWARAVRGLQDATRDRLGAFVAALGDLGPHATMDAITGLPEVLEGLASKHALPWSDRVPDALATTAAPLADPSGQRLSPGDPCPDNNLVDGPDLRLIDFEFAEVRHRAWDAAYLRVPWPSCWCAWQLPREVADRAARELGVEADGPIDEATLLWCLLSTSWFLAGALDTTSVNSDTDRRPGRRTLILGRLALAASLPGPAALTSYAADLRDALHRRWGDHPTSLAPAFR